MTILICVESWSITRSAWKRQKLLTGYNKKSNLPTPDNDFAQDLNEFYARFDKYDFSCEIDDLCQTLIAKNDPMIEITEDDVLESLNMINKNKATGPDKVSGHVLKNFNCVPHCKNSFKIQC